MNRDRLANIIESKKKYYQKQSKNVHLMNILHIMKYRIGYYRDVIRSNPFMAHIQFGKFFKNNGGIEPHISFIYHMWTKIHPGSATLDIKNHYFYGMEKDIEIRDDPNDYDEPISLLRTIKNIDYQFIFSFYYNDNIYYACLLGKQDNGSCETCGMGSYDNKVIYIAETMLQLLNICTIAEYEAIYKHFLPN